MITYLLQLLLLSFFLSFSYLFCLFVFIGIHSNQLTNMPRDMTFDDDMRRSHPLDLQDEPICDACDYGLPSVSRIPLT